MTHDTDETMQLPPAGDPHPTPPTMGGGFLLDETGEARPLDRPPERIGDYVVLGELGRGAMGAVYKVRHPRLGKDYAAKVLIAGEHASADSLKRFRREADAMARLDQHPLIVGVHDAGSDGPLHFIVMDLVEGPSLAGMVQLEPLAIRQALEITRDVAEALHHAHRSGILHRDVKPGNILVDGNGRAHLADFGLARALGGDGTLTAPGTVVGTPVYSSPEQAQGQLSDMDGRSDVYSLGAVMYETLVGGPPVEGETILNILQKVVSEDPVPPRKRDPHIPAEVERICLKAMEKNPERRYQSAEEMARDCDRVLRGEQPAAGATSGTYRTVRLFARKRALVIGGALVALAGLTALGLAVQARRARHTADAETQTAKDREAAAAQAQAQAGVVEAAATEQAAAAESEAAAAKESAAARTAAAPHLTAARRALGRGETARRIGDAGELRRVRRAAVAELEQAVAHDASDGEAWLLLGRTLLQLGKLDAAAQPLARAIARRPDDADPVFEQARMRFQRLWMAGATYRWQRPGVSRDAAFVDDPDEEYRLLVGDLDRLQLLQAEPARVEYVKGVAAWAAKTEPRAEAALRAAIAADTYATDALVALGGMLERQSNASTRVEDRRALLREARALLDRAAKLEPADPMILVQRTLAAEHAGELPSMRQELERATESDASEALWPYLLAKAHARLGDAPATLRRYTQAIERDENFAEALIDRGALLASTDLAAALRDLDRAVALAPDMYEAWMNRGGVKFRLQDNDGALKDYDRAVIMDKESPAAYANRGAVRFNSGDADGAWDDCNEALKRKPDYALALQVRSRIALDRGDFRAVVEDCNVALAAHPARHDFRAWRAMALAYSGEAHKALEDVTEHTLRHQEGWVARVLGMADSGHAAEAVQIAQQVEAAGAAVGPWWYGAVGRAYWQSGRKDRAVELWDTVLATLPDHPVAQVIAKWKKGD